MPRRVPPTVARFHFEGERTIGMELITDPVEALRACQTRDAAWHHAAHRALIRAKRSLGGRE